MLQSSLNKMYYFKKPWYIFVCNLPSTFGFVGLYIRMLLSMDFIYLGDLGKGLAKETERWGGEWGKSKGDGKKRSNSEEKNERGRREREGEKSKGIGREIERKKERERRARGTKKERAG